jgi:hypothetical protein
MGRVCRVRVWSIAFFTVFSWLAGSPAHAEGEKGGSQRAGGGAARPTLTITRAAQAPTIDGRLDDPIWKTAAVIDKLVQETPVEGAPATEQTEVRVAYDSDKIYFGIYAHYSNPSLVRANRADRDKTDDDDTVTVFLESFLDFLRGYSFSYQFTPRLLVRNITELNSELLSNHTLFENILVTYRVNSGTVFYVGYDDRYKAGDAINAEIFQDSTYQRTNRAVFTKVQYLFRGGGNN